jgi:hypothetical protein
MRWIKFYSLEKFKTDMKILYGFIFTSTMTIKNFCRCMLSNKRIVRPYNLNQLTIKFFCTNIMGGLSRNRKKIGKVKFKKYAMQ